MNGHGYRPLAVSLSQFIVVCAQIHVGNTTYYIGELELARSTDRFVMSLPFTSGVAAASGILLTAILIICIAYHRKSRESDRIVRCMHTQMDALEARVANECKEGLDNQRVNMSPYITNSNAFGNIIIMSITPTTTINNNKKKNNNYVKQHQIITPDAPTASFIYLFIFYAIRQHKNTQNTHYTRKISTLIKAIKSCKILNYLTSNTGLHFL